MRTVDPEIWSKRIKKPKIQASRANKFGQQLTHRYERIFRESLVDAAFEYWGNCSVPAIKYINLEDMTREERYCYVLLLLVTLGLGILLVSYNCHTYYVTPPLVINSQSSEVFMTDVTFPAVAICSNNIISRAAMKNYSEYLFNHPINQGKTYSYTRSEIDGYLSNLGALLSLSVSPIQLKFTQFLMEVHPVFNISDIMFRLTPPCNTMLHRCSWRGQLVPCDSLFAARVTPLGFCCVFNSRYYPVDANNKPKVLDLIGQNYGLGIVIVEDRDDFVHLRRNVNGAEMLLFEGSEYPLLESGDVRMYPIQHNVSMFINVKGLLQQVNDDVKYYSEEWRGCRTDSPGQSWCLTNCRRDTTAALCGCVPYTLAAGNYNDTRRICAIRDLPCLKKHREKFMYLYPTTSSDDDPHLSEEKQDGLICFECRVLCRRQLYAATISYSHFSKKYKLYRNFLTKGLHFVNTSTVRLFYNSGKHELYSLEAYLRWYEILVKLSTQWTAVAGVSTLAAVELLYHATFRFMHHFIRRLRLANLQSAAPSM